MGTKARPISRTRLRGERLHCACGGILRPARLDSFDFGPLVGLPFPIVIPNVPGFRCNRCRGETISGTVIEIALAACASATTRLPFRLPGPLVRYLRRYQRLTQAELAERMGVHRVTVANWESGAEIISPSADMVLRGLILSKLLTDPPLGLEVVARDAGETLRAVRTAEPQPDARLDPALIENYLRHARLSERSAP